MKKILLPFVLLLCFYESRAQNAHLRIVSLLNFPDTAYQGTAYPIAFHLKNVGLAPFTGPLQIILQTDTAFDIVYFSNNPNFVLYPNDTITLSTTQGGAFGYVFTPQVFKPGNDVVVVWPYSTQMNVDYDSIYTSVYFVPLSTVVGQDGRSKDGISVYPNPFNEEIFIEADERQVVEQVRIYSIDGKFLPVTRNLHNRYSMYGLIPGIYILEIRMADGSVSYLKMIKAL